jgi:ubiquinone biosynthesis monooxygenase Coq7
VGDEDLSAFFQAAADEERDHLAWTAQRLRELHARPSALMPMWYLGSLIMGALAGLGGGRLALGFMAETERQVEAHLQGHLERLPTNDSRSRAIVMQMKLDEARHADQARSRDATPMPRPVAAAMRLMSRVMTTVAYRL